MQQIGTANIWMWSQWKPERGMCFNSYYIALPSGNIVVDPLPAPDAIHAQIAQRGGVQSIFITNRDHVRDAPAWRERYGAELATSAAETDLPVAVDRLVKHREFIARGVQLLAVRDQKSPGESILYLPDQALAIVGDAVIGAPAGELSLLPDEAYADVQRAVLSLRVLWSLPIVTLLVGEGTGIFGNAREVLGRLLQSRGGIAVNRANVDELEYVPYLEAGAKYESAEAELGRYLGAKQLGYVVTILPPGVVVCPMHNHLRSEELLIVLEGRPSVRTPGGTIECRPGDVVALPTGASGTHQFRNDSDAPAKIFLLGTEPDVEVCFYPESSKVGIYGEYPAPDLMVRTHPVLDYFDGE